MIEKEELNQKHVGHVLSIDIPSGLNADTGTVMGTAVTANVTATFMGIKKGMLTNDGPDCSGEIAFSRLNIPNQSYESLATLSWEWKSPRQHDSIQHA